LPPRGDFAAMTEGQIQTAFFAAFRGEALTVLLAGLAANSIGSLVKGLIPLRASVPSQGW
jgi:hypothetical protein